MALEDHPIWARPKHHHDLDNPSDHVHWIELFYDLIHVVTVFMLGNYLSHHLGVSGFLVFAGIFAAVWFAWGESSVFNSLYVSTDVNHRLLMTAQILTVMVIASSIPAIDGKGWPYFALAYAANRVITGIMWYRTQRHNVGAASLADKMARYYFVMAVVFTVSAFLPQPWGWVLFGAGVLCMQLYYMIPGLTPLTHERFKPRVGHIAERFALLLLIVVGEGFFKLVVTLGEKGIYKVGPDVFMNFFIGGAALFVQCWIYFDFVGNNSKVRTDPANMVRWWLSHLLLMLSAVMVGVAMAAEVKVGFFEPYPVKYGVLGCTGLALYIFSMWSIKHTIEPKIEHQFATDGLQFFGIAMALITLVVFPWVPSWAGNMLWGTGLFSQIIVPLSRARKALA